MRAKRQKDRKAIASFQQGRQERQEQQERPACPAPQQEEEGEEEDTEQGVEVLLLSGEMGVQAPHRAVPRTIQMGACRFGVPPWLLREAMTEPGFRCAVAGPGSCSHPLSKTPSPGVFGARNLQGVGTQCEVTPLRQGPWHPVPCHKLPRAAAPPPGHPAGLAVSGVCPSTLLGRDRGGRAGGTGSCAGRQGSWMSLLYLPGGWAAQGPAT